MESSSFNVTLWNDEGNEEEEKDDMLGQALPVPPFDINSVNENSFPLTSQEYLQQVIAQRAKLPAVVTVPAPKLKNNASNYATSLFPEENIEKSEHSPSKEWQQKQVSEFSDLRYRVECGRDNWKRKCPLKFPSNKSSWYQFMFEENAEDKCRKQPLLDIVLNMNNEMVTNLIKYTTDWVADGSLTVYEAGEWLFALLACVDVPLPIKMVKKMRSFAFKCRDLRKKIDLSIASNENELTAQNLFICLIGRYFGQHDLSDYY